MATSRKRARDIADDGFAADGTMTRVRPAPDPGTLTTLSSLSTSDWAVLERTAVLLGVPLATLLGPKQQGPPAPESPRVFPRVIEEEPHLEPTGSPPTLPLHAPADELSKTTSTQHRLSDLSYGYDHLEDWAPPPVYQAPDYVAVARNVDGSSHTSHSQQVPRGVSLTSPRFGINGGDGETSRAVGGSLALEVAAAASSFFTPSPATSSDADRVLDLSEAETNADALGALTDSSTWSLVPAFSGSEDTSVDPQVGASRDVVPVTFVSVNPLEPVVHARRKRGAFESDELREETNRTRQLKACLRCRMQRIRCQIDGENPAGSCRSCQTMGARKIHNLPCLRYRLTECTEFRVGKAAGMQYSARWPEMKLKDISDWASPEIRTITVAAEVSPVSFSLQVRKFVPMLQDSMRRSWMDGRDKRYKKTTPYAIADVRAAMTTMRSYISESVFKCMDHFLRDSDELVKVTFKHAKAYWTMRADSEDEVKLLKNYMTLWAAVRRTATLDYIVSQDTLDMSPVMDDKSSPFFGKVPLPPVMIQQLDIILTEGMLRPLQKAVLDDLQRLILSNNPKTWMTMYLITFMSLHSCSSLVSENYRNARRQGYRRRFSFPQFIQERHNSANVFLGHYHYRTEQCDPFKLDWKKRHTTPFADMPTQDVIFLQKTAALLSEKDRAETIRCIKEEDLYENELYLVSQMFETNWQPRDMKIEYDEGTIYGGPVKVYYDAPV